MTRVVATVGLMLLFLIQLPISGQQTALTEGMLKASEIEVPQLVELMELKPGMTVADVGAGFGAWTMRFSRFIGPNGRVYASDVGAPQLAALREIVQREKLTNVTVLEGSAASTNLPPACCDAILVRDVYHHLTQPADIIKSIAASLKPGGRLAVIDFPPRPKSEVPAGVPANRLGHGVPPDVVHSEVSAALTHMRTISSWVPTGSTAADLYLLLFRKSS
jgi:ubiquinone/menaquinone biosynthesis C-methylase UbiE